MAKTLNGNCYLCGAELGKTPMKNHILKAHADESGEECYLLKIEGAYNNNYWLIVDIPLNKTLASLDKFLRKIWLECCGHLSSFSLGGYGEISPSRKISSLNIGDKILHEYDFGSTTETVVTVMEKTIRKKQPDAVRLLARNIPPAFICDKCGKPADVFCTECVYEKENPFYCNKCNKTHEHDEMTLNISNSPRMGECGYEGEYDTYKFDSSKFAETKPKKSNKKTGKLIFLCYPKCTTCKKAQNWLSENQFIYEIRDIKQHNPTVDELRKWHDKSALPLKKFFNTSGLQYKALNLKDKLPSMSEDEQFNLLATDGMLIKRPMLIGEDFVLVGFKEEEWDVLKNRKF